MINTKQKNEPFLLFCFEKIISVNMIIPPTRINQLLCAFAVFTIIRKLFIKIKIYRSIIVAKKPFIWILIVIGITINVVFYRSGA
jgi:hypothetical protein